MVRITENRWSDPPFRALCHCDLVLSRPDAGIGGAEDARNCVAHISEAPLAAIGTSGQLCVEQVANTFRVNAMVRYVPLSQSDTYRTRPRDPPHSAIPLCMDRPLIGRLRFGSYDNPELVRQVRTFFWCVTSGRSWSWTPRHHPRRSLRCTCLFAALRFRSRRRRHPPAGSGSSLRAVR